MSEKPVASIKTLARYEPDTVYIGTGEYVAECVRADDGDYYLAADADAAIEALQAEIERLAEALRLIESATDRLFGIDYVRVVAQRALMRDKGEGHEQ